MADLAPDWELGRREVVLLGLACRQADMAAALDAVMQRDGPMVRGSKDQQVLHPANRGGPAGTARMRAAAGCVEIAR
jgi:hypothetical protein